MCLCITYESPINKRIGLVVPTSLCLLLRVSTLRFIVKICVCLFAVLIKSEGFNASKDYLTEREREREAENEITSVTPANRLCSHV